MKKKSENRFGAPSFPMSALHLTALFSMTLSQPLFNLISRNTEFLVARQSEPIDIVALIVLLSVMVPLVFIGIAGLAQLINQKLRIWALFLFVSSLVTALALQAINPVFSNPGYVIIAGAGLIGIVAATAYFRYPAIRLFLTILSPAILIFPILFIFNSPVRTLIFVDSNPETVKPPSIEIGKTPPIVMVILDELPVTSLMNQEGKIDSSRYPNFATLARDAYWFRNATTVSTTTADAVPAILSGLYPKRLRLPNADGYPNNLFTLLGGIYSIKAKEPVTRLCPRHLCEEETDPFLIRMQSMVTDLSVVYLHILLPEDLTSTLPVVNQTWKHFTAPAKRVATHEKHWTRIKKTKDRRRTLLNVIDHELKRDRGNIFRRFIASIERVKTPTFYFAHSYLPHTPWVNLPSGKKYMLSGNKIQGLTDGRWDNALFSMLAYQHHLLQVGFVDTLLGELISKLKQTDLYDRALVIVTADHGISFRPNDMRRGLTPTNYPDIMPVPLFIKLPHQHESIIDDENVETIDILPTIADVLNIDLPWSVDGRSVVKVTYPERENKIIYTVFRNTPEHKNVFGPDGYAKYKTVTRKHRLFGEGSDLGGLYTIGPYSNLIGKKIRLERPIAGSGLTVTIDNEELYDRVDLNSSYIPAHITGRLHADNKSEIHTIAVAVNGVVSGVTRTFVNPVGETVFSAIAPESSFRSGRNQLDVFIVDETGEEQVLSQVNRKKMIAFSFSTPDRLKSSQGDTIKITKGVILGSLDRIKLQNDNVSLIGWAASKEPSNFPDVIAVFVNDRFFYTGVINRNRRDVVDYFNDESLLRSGFHFQFSSEMFRNIKKAEIRVFGVSKNGIASELTYPKGNLITRD